MSYIFNEFSTGAPDGPAFSSVVAVAREKGYTVCQLKFSAEFVIHARHRNLIQPMI